jgi:acyl-CoA dehydrogenase
MAGPVRIWAGKMSITADEREALLFEVERFARGTIEPHASRPELPMDGAAIGGVLRIAESLGLAAVDGDPTGLGPWEGLGEGAPPGATLDVLRCIGRANAGVGYTIHQRGLARAVATAVGLGSSLPTPLAIAPEGTYGLGRVAFARFLAGAPLTPEDRALLSDAYDPLAPRVVTVEPGTGGLLTPVWAQGTTIQWQAHPWEALEVRSEGPAHGIDELVTATVRPVASASVHPQRTSDPHRDGLLAPFAAHQLGLLALATGAVERALSHARAFAAQRWQGGALIDRHPAVLDLLGGGSATVRSTRVQLDAFAARPLDAAALVDALALRSEAHPALADAANAALQVFGGLGYMRDNGLEKAVRDVNHLRAFAGNPTELRLIVAEWERLHA